MMTLFPLSQTHLQIGMTSLQPMRYKGKLARGAFGEIVFIGNGMEKRGWH